MSSKPYTEYFFRPNFCAVKMLKMLIFPAFVIVHCEAKTLHRFIFAVALSKLFILK